MRPSSPIPADAAIVQKLNEIFYDVEAELYDERHPEVIEGDASWWTARAVAVIADLRASAATSAGLRILDIGCGTGFVSSLLATTHLLPNDRLVGIDQSAGMLLRAASKLAAEGGDACHLARGDATRLPFAEGSFQMLTVNSFLHHVFDHHAVLREIDRVLARGGYLLLAHEPNRDFFRSPWIRAAAAAYKLIGFGMKVPRDLRNEINARLRKSALALDDLSGDEILRLVEFHSPVEQRAIGIDHSKGFSLHDFLARELKGYDLIEHQEYSTFHHRPLFEQKPRLMRMVKTAAGWFEGRGNLFRAVLRKPC